MKKLLTLIITALLLIPTASTAQTTKNRQSKGAQSKISTSTLRGDVNGDGDTNITDVALTVNHILGNSSGTFNEAAADLNGDGEVNITDVVKLVDIILNGSNVPDLELSSTTVVVTEESATVEIVSGSGNYELTVSDPDIIDASLDGSKVIITSKVPGTMEVEVTQTTPANTPRKAPAIHHSTVSVKDVDTGQTADINVTITEEEALICPDDNHPHMIDLGLPSGTKWACCNVGADKPEGYGVYYAWGETEEKDYYDWSTYIHCDGSIETCHDLGSDIAGTQYDVAHIKWGDSWVMPSNDQEVELYNNCTYTWTIMNGVEGGLFTGPNGGTIFLPAAGHRLNNNLSFAGLQGEYWSSTQDPSYLPNACNLSNNSYNAIEGDNRPRCFGLTVRPVYVEAPSSNLCPDDNHPHMIDLGLPSGTKWACCNVDDDHSKQSPTNHGSYYAWGETEEKDYYDDDNYEFFEGYNYWEYEDDEIPFPIYTDLGSDIAGTRYDVANHEWGDSWVMPSWDQMKELSDNCAYEWTTVNGVYGMKFTSNFNGCSIFMPAAGYREYDELDGFGSYGHYWSSTQYTDDDSYYANKHINRLLTPSDLDTVPPRFMPAYPTVYGAYYLYFRSDYLYSGISYSRSDGRTVRPVCKETPSSNLCPDENHPHMIDLGLSSGTLWSCCNVGANKPEGYGGYYAWGETAEKSEYGVYTYAHYDWDEDNFIYIGDHIANTQFDVAHSLWQSNWRMPTQEQCEELLECMTEETTINNVNGLLIIGPNDNSIFLPFAGFRYETDLPEQGSYGGYWSDTYNDGQSAMAMHLPYSSTLGWEPREVGQSVRPVYVEVPSSNLCPDDNHPHMIDLGLPSGTKWACCNVDDDHSKQSPTNYGSYYAWGETKEHEDSLYDWSNYIHCDGSYDTCHDLGSDIAGTEFDVAHVKWGGSWVMPSREQQDELRYRCTYTWTTVNGVNGGQFTGPNGNSIFIPAAGYFRIDSLLNVGSLGNCWSSTVYDDYRAWELYFYPEGKDRYANSRDMGFSVRPVSK